MSTDDYKAVNAILGLDPSTGGGDWPTVLLSHTGAAGNDGGFIVFEVWDSQQSQEAFLASRLGPALGKAGVREPERMEWLSVVGHYNP